MAVKSESLENKTVFGRIAQQEEKRCGGMSDALSLVADLGFSVNPPPSQDELQKLSTGTDEKADDLVRVLRDLTLVQRKIADLQVEL